MQENDNSEFNPSWMDPDTFVKPSDFKKWFGTSPKQTSKLPAGFSHHVFLSYRQISGLSEAKRLVYDLKERGFKVWWDMELDRELNKEAMLEGVRGSMCYLLLLSEEVYSSYVVAEASEALKLGKPILAVSHPKTDSVD